MEVRWNNATLYTHRPDADDQAERHEAEISSIEYDLEQELGRQATRQEIAQRYEELYRVELD
jgi:hypothetical protein